MDMICKIVDRDKETETLLDDINNASNFVVNILYARTAVGKSTVTDKLSYLMRGSKKHCVVVRNNPINNSKQQEWDFLKAIFYELKDLFKNNRFLSFSEFIKTDDMFYNIKEEKKLTAFNTTTAKIPIAAVALAVSYDSTGFEERVLSENNSVNICVMQKYIWFIFANTEMVLIIDNLHNIDASTQWFFKRTFKLYSNKKHYIIFEYTLKDGENTEKVQTYNEFFSHEKIVSKTTFINNTDEKYIPDIIDKKVPIKPKSFGFNKDMVDHYLARNTGNIRELIDFSLSYSPTEKKINDNKTIRNILALSREELFVLYCILVFNGKIDSKTLLALCEQNKLNGYELTKLLIKKGFIKGDRITEFDHASIADALNTKNVLLESTAVCAEKAVKDYIESLMRENINNALPFLNVILKIYYKSYPAELEKLFGVIENSVFINIQPSMALVYLKAFFDIAIANAKNHCGTLFKVIGICFKFELYEDGHYCLCRLGEEINIDTTPVFHIYKMMYLAALDRHSENIEYYNTVIDRMTDTRIKLNLHLSVLSSYRSLGDISNCLKIHKLLGNKKYRTFPEYGYRLRLVDMYLSRKRSIPYVKKSISFFEKIGNLEQAAKSRITYTHLLGGLGKTKKAVEQIQTANRFLADKILGQHMLFVNRAVLYLVDGDYTRKVYDLLDMAENSAIVPFDKLAIIVNKLVWCYENDRFDLVHSLRSEADKLLEKEPDKHIHCLYYYNMYACSIKENNPIQAKEYFAQAKSLQQYCMPVRNRLGNIYSRETRFIVKKPWHICYLTYWTYNILFE